MLEHKDDFHGSDLMRIEELYGINKDEIVSFSANVNPLGISPLLKKTVAEEIDCISSYPDREYRELKQVIAGYLNTSEEKIIPGNGSTELISMIIDIKRPGKTLIIGPTYSEYEREVSLSGGKSYYYQLKEKRDFRLDMDELNENLRNDVDMLIICNPNNPTSTVINRNDLRTIMDICKERDIFVMVDETYIEFVHDREKTEGIPLTDYYNNLFIIRGVSKFFAAPGLRLGYAVTGNRDLIREVGKIMNPWTINSLAEAAGKVMFKDSKYIEKTVKLIEKERKYVTERLSAMSATIKTYEPSANFILFRIDSDSVNADTLFDSCIMQKMMIRNCCTFPFLDNRYVRICFMNHEDNVRLLNCIERELTG
ncbi:MAG: aminotransferase class I/II-fold pyridoxal phosphate-dependent enzyme [Lachnospiraceae bacterium]|nr:aminotransferase class I/II-fold pyridoxal phosphate-dependent enzyme [Lachnospiraceae bacterium]